MTEAQMQRWVLAARQGDAAAATAKPPALPVQPTRLRRHPVHRHPPHPPPVADHTETTL